MLRNVALAVLALSLAGCGVSPAIHPTALSLQVGGSVRGGQQAIGGSLVQIYAAGTTGDGSAATPLLTQPVYTDSNGNFNITGDYTCPSNSLVYLVATGGNPGLASTVVNPNIALMTAIGPCSSLKSTTFLTVNELTTVAAVNALQPFFPTPFTFGTSYTPITMYASMGSSATDANLLTAAFANASQFVSTGTGTAPGSGVPTGHPHRRRQPLACLA